MRPTFPARFLCTCLLSVAICGAAPRAADADAITVAAAIEELRRDIARETEILARERAGATERRIALAGEVATLEADVAALRRNAEWTIRLGDEADARLATLREQDRALSAQLRSLAAQLSDAARELDARSDIVESHLSRAFTEALRAVTGDATAEPAHLPAAAGAFAAELARRLTHNRAVTAVPGTAIAPDGRELEGTYIRAGAAQAWFLPRDSERPAGGVRLEHGSVVPHLCPLPDPALRGALADLAGGKGATVPFDVTGGGALSLPRDGRTVVEWFAAGGIIMWPILLVALTGLFAALGKCWQLLRISSRFDAPLDEVISLILRGQEAEARARAAKTLPPLRRLLLEGLAHRQAPREDLEEMLHEAIIMEVPPLERHLSLLSVGAAVAPLLGLLGTVTGIIAMFQVISVFGNGDPRLMSGGISEALITTEAGLGVAIPLLLCHALLTRRVHAIAEGLEKAALSFINTVKTREATGTPATPGREDA